MELFGHYIRNYEVIWICTGHEHIAYSHVHRLYEVISNLTNEVLLLCSANNFPHKQIVFLGVITIISHWLSSNMKYGIS